MDIIVLILIAGIVLIFLLCLFFFQIKFILNDLTTSEYLRSDKYSENLNDEGYKKNFIKFLKGWDSENNYIYNDNARELIMKNVTIEKFYLDLYVKSRAMSQAQNRKNSRKQSKEYGINRVTRERLDSVISNKSNLDDSGIEEKIEKEHFETGGNEDSASHTIN